MASADNRRSSTFWGAWFGKSFLLYHLARDGWGLFLIDSDGNVAAALREQRPSVVIVDDAHAQPEILVKLRQLRQQTKMEFSIVATTWEGARDQESRRWVAYQKTGSGSWSC